MSDHFELENVGPGAVVELNSPALEHNPGVDAIPKPLHRLALISNRAVETLVGPVSSWLARINEDGFYGLFGQRCIDGIHMA